MLDLASHKTSSAHIIIIAPFLCLQLLYCLSLPQVRLNLLAVVVVAIVIMLVSAVAEYYPSLPQVRLNLLAIVIRCHCTCPQVRLNLNSLVVILLKTAVVLLNTAVIAHCTLLSIAPELSRV